MIRSFTYLGLCIPTVLYLFNVALAVDPAMQPFQGKWQVVQLIEDGQAVPAEAIAMWMPSGGKVDIVENAIIFESPVDHRKYAKTFSVAPPNHVVILSPDGKKTTGIFGVDASRMTVCIADPTKAPVPTDFTCTPGSHRMLMELQRIGSSPSVSAQSASYSQMPNTTPVITANPSSGQPLTTSPPPIIPGVAPPAGAQQIAPTTQPALVPLTDPQVIQQSIGSWILPDPNGAIVLNLGQSGDYSSLRNMNNMQMFQKSFAPTPTTQGKWSVTQGVLRLQVVNSIRPELVNQTLQFSVKTIGAKQLVMVDQYNRVVTMERLQ